MIKCFIFLVDQNRGEELCFACSVKRIISNDYPDADIKIHTSDYGYNRCEMCGRYLDDIIEL